MSNKITELDYKKLVDSLREYLRNDSRFTDYDFEGSGISMIINLLAYNTLHNAFYVNMVGSEMFLDSADLRESVVSLAKHLNYTPRSVRSSKAFVNISFLNPGTVTQIVIPKGTAFSSRGTDDRIYSFTTTETKVITPNPSGNFIANDVELIEGIRLSHTFDVDYSGPDKPRFILPNPNVDTTDLVVRVRENPSSSVALFYQKADNINELKGGDLVYFIQEIEGGLFEIYFGDDIIGKEPSSGSQVIIEYVVSNGPRSNGCKRFAPINGVAGYPNSGVSITTTSNSAGGSLAESKESVKLLAPLNWEAQDRAVTVQDYETLIKKDNPQVEFVRVWGGEDNDPPQYGRVFVSLKPFDTVRLSTAQKQSIVKDVLRKRNLVSIEVVPVDPKPIYVEINSTIRYQSSVTSKTGNDIKTDVLNSITSYRNSELSGFDRTLRFSKLTKSIDQAENSILNNETFLTIKDKIIPPLNVPTRFVINFNNELSKGDAQNDISSISSTSFVYKGQTSFLGDDGKGSIYIFRFVANVKVIFEFGVGTIDYSKGEIILSNLNIQSIPSGNEFVEIKATPLKKDLFSERNQIFIIDNDDVKLSVIDETTGKVY
jgi:hypothetical protein